MPDENQPIILNANGNGPWGSSGSKGSDDGKGPQDRGPWGSGPRGSGPQGSGGGNNTPPDLEELIKKGQDRLKQFIPGQGGGNNGGGANGGGIGSVSPVVIGFAALAILAFVLYNFFTFRVEPDQQGVVLRFGEISRTAVPGLSFRLPYPIESVYKPQVTRINRIDVGTTDSASRSNTVRDVPEESLMLTGDENIVDVDFAVFWKINNASDFLFNIKDTQSVNPAETIKAVSESAMREIVGGSDIQPILTQARQITEAAVQELIQATLDEYKSGVLITQVQLLKVDPPGEVIGSFRDVQAARADAERSQNEAQTFTNQLLPQARGEAARIMENAQAYQEQTIAEAEGQASRFISIYDQYVLAPEVTRKRMFLETMERVFSATNKVIMENGAAAGVVPYLPLTELGGKPNGASSQTRSTN